MLGWLSTGFWFFSLTIHILISRSIEVESAELNSSTIHLAVTRHTNSFLLIKNPALITGGPP